MGNINLESETMANILDMVNKIKQQIKSSWGNRVVYVYEMELLEENKIDLDEVILNKLILSVSVITEDLQTGKLLIDTQLEMNKDHVQHTEGYVDDIYDWLKEFTRQQFIPLPIDGQRDKTASAIDQVSEHGSVTFSAKPFYEYLSLKGKDRKLGTQLILTDLYLPTNVRLLKEQLEMTEEKEVKDVQIGNATFHLVTQVEEGKLYVVGYTSVEIVVEEKDVGNYTRLVYLPYTVGVENQKEIRRKIEMWEQTILNCSNM